MNHGIKEAGSEEAINPTSRRTKGTAPRRPRKDSEFTPRPTGRRSGGEHFHEADASPTAANPKPRRQRCESTASFSAIPSTPRRPRCDSAPFSTLRARRFREESLRQMSFHANHPSLIDDAMNNTDAMSGKTQFFKTKLCPWYQRGTCDRSVDCSYAHSLEEMRPKPDLVRTRLCENFARDGTCSRKNCMFAHSVSELRATGWDRPGGLVTRTYYKTRLCVYFAKGKCELGENCRHAHGDEELRPLRLDVETDDQSEPSTEEGGDSSCDQSAPSPSERAKTAAVPNESAVAEVKPPTVEESQEVSNLDPVTNSVYQPADETEEVATEPSKDRTPPAPTITALQTQGSALEVSLLPATLPAAFVPQVAFLQPSVHTVPAPLRNYMLDPDTAWNHLHVINAAVMLVERPSVYGE